MAEHEDPGAAEGTKSKSDFFGGLVEQHEENLNPAERERQAQLGELFKPIATLLETTRYDQELDIVDGYRNYHFTQKNANGLRYTEIPLLDNEGNEVDPDGAEVKVRISGTAIDYRNFERPRKPISVQGHIDLAIVSKGTETKKPAYEFEMTTKSSEGDEFEDVKIYALDQDDPSKRTLLDADSPQFKELANIAARQEEIKSGEFFEGTNPEVIEAEQIAARDAKERAIVEEEEALEDEARLRLEVQSRNPEVQRDAVRQWIERNLDNVRDQIRQERKIKKRQEQQ